MCELDRAANARGIAQPEGRSTEMKIYKTTIRPVVTYSSGTWTATAKAENNLGIFEKQVLMKIFAPVNIDNMWR